MTIQSLPCRAAFAQVDITPDFPVDLIGYARPGPVRAVLHPLFAQLILWERGGERFCLITLDTLGFTTSLAQINRRPGCSVVDRRLGGLLLENAQTHAPIVLLLRTCAHANVLTGSQISSVP